MGRDARSQVDRSAEKLVFTLDDLAAIHAGAYVRKFRLALDFIAQAQRGPHHGERVGARAEDVVADAVDDSDPGFEACRGETLEPEHDLRGIQCAVRLGKRRVSGQVGDQQREIDLARFAKFSRG